VEDPDFIVLLTAAGGGSTGPAALRAVRDATGLSLWQSKRLLLDAPTVASGRTAHAVAVRIAEQLRRAGVPAALQCDWCRRTLPEDGAPVDPGPCASPYWPTAHCAANSTTACDCGFCVAS